MNTRVKALFIILAVAGWVSCKKNNDAPTISLTTNVNFVNASNNVINFYINGSRINNTPSYFPGGTLGYIPVVSGKQDLQVKIAGSDNANPLFTLPLALDTGKKYTVYVSGIAVENTFFTTDTLKAATGNVATVRFVNASPDAGPLALLFEGGSAKTVIIDTTKFDKIPYKITTAFINVPSGTHNLGIYRSSLGLASVVRDTVTLTAGRIYTVYGYGSVGQGGNQALSTGLIVNQ